MASDKDLKADLGALLNFLNSDIEAMSEKELQDTIFTLALDQGPRKTGLGVLDVWQAIDRLGGNLSSSPERFKEVKNFMLNLQAHLRSRFDAIMGANTASQKIVTSLFEAKVVRRILIDPMSDLFEEEFVALESHGDPLDKEKRYIDARLARLIFGLSLKPGGFKRCLRCEKYFVQFSLREREFCSTRCAGAARQARWVEDQKEKLSLLRTADIADTADTADGRKSEEKYKGGKETKDSRIKPS